jgi:peptidoglycan/LPS O-acetylase OafA/YrhL
MADHKPKHLYHPKYRSDINGLRGVAILLVVLFHISQGWKSMENILHAGFIGVDIFFVISGFLISTIIFKSLESNNFNFLEFYSRRVKRLFPSLIVVLLSSLLFGFFFLFPADFEYLGKHVLGSTLYINNFFLLKEAGYFDATAELKPLLHLWSLAIEEQFYIIWPLVIYMIFKTKKSLLPIIIFFAFSSFAAHLYFLKLNHNASFYLPYLRAWELLIGSFVAYLNVYSKNNLGHNSVLFFGFTYTNVQSFVGLTLLVLGLFFIQDPQYFPGWMALIFPVMGAALIIHATEDAWVNRKIFSSKILIWFGLISYPLYLWHWPLLAFERIIEGKLVHHDTKLLIFFLSILLAAFTYHCIENPIRRSLKIKSIHLLMSVFFIGLISVFIFKFNGLPSRFPKEIAFINEPYDFHYRELVREKICHMDDEKTKSHLTVCYEKKRPLIGLWGDSFASALYPGLKKLQDQKHFGIMQLTRGGCPFLLNAGDIFVGNCDKINIKVLSELKNESPNLLILGSSYIHEPRYKWKNVQQLQEKFKETLFILKRELPHTKIIVIGPMPQWPVSPQKTVFHYWLKASDKKKELPFKSKANLFNDVDSVLKHTSKDMAVLYISPYSILCEGSECLTRVSNKAEDFIAVDWGHLSRSGSEYFISKISNIILEQLNIQ